MPDDLRLPLGLAAFLTIWFFFVGGCIGSFLNVVIYRLPLGLSVVSPPSRCPACGAGIRWYHNLPVLGWLILRGRCRDCGTPISARYPTVEFLVGLLFLLMAVQAFLPGGPWWLLNVPSQLILENLLKITLAYAYYMLLVCTLLCAAYIAWDGERQPGWLFFPCLLAGLTVPAVWNDVRPLVESAEIWQFSLLRGVVAGVWGAACGLLWGAIYDRARGLPRGQVTPAAVTIGWMLGWQVAALALAIGTLVALVWLMVGRSWRAAVAAPLAGVTLVASLLVLAGGLVFARWPVLQVLPNIGLIVVAAGIVLLTGLAARKLAPPAPQPETPPVDVMFP